jgi:DNA-binding SARP family transcriptional activator/tetratricopeptide (TPR) repeat protein
MAVDVALLGPLAVSVDGADATPTAPKERMLLALLAMRADMVVPDEQLVEDIWPELDVVRGRHVLQVRIAALRKLLGAAGVGDVILKRGGGYVLALRAETLDARRFEMLVAQAAASAGQGSHDTAAELLREALGLWRGDALVDVDSCLRLRAEATRYRELRLGALESRITADLACGRHRTVIAELEGLIATHRYREPLSQLAALALYRCGRQADALEVCNRIRNALREELGLDPGPALRELEQAILQQRSELDAPVIRRAPSNLPGLLEQARTEQLIARQPELAVLKQLFLAVGSAGEPRLALIQGEAGIGKTRLVAELAVELATQGALVLAGRCDEEPLASYQPFREAFRAAGTQPLVAALQSIDPADRQELARLDPSLAPSRSMVGDGNLFQLFEAVAALLGALAHAAPILLVIEDLHWADRSTQRLLAHIVSHPTCGGVLIAATARPDGVAPGASALLRRPERVEHLHLSGLKPTEIEALISALLDDEPEADVTSAVHRASGGNPLYAREIVRHVRDSGRVSLTRVLSVPPELETIILRRAERLGPETAQVLTAAAVLGQVFSLDVLGATTGQDADSVLDALAPAVTAGLLTETAPDQFAFSHAVVRDALNRSMLASRRNRLHARAAAHLESVAPDRLAKAVEHLREAGDLVEPAHLVSVLTRAAEQAFQAVAYDEAAELFALAVEAGPVAGLYTKELARLQLRQGIAREATGDPQGKEAIRLAALYASEVGEPELFAEGALAFARMPLMVTNADPATVALLEKALDELGSLELPVRARIGSRLAYELFWEVGDRRAKLASESLQLARRIGDPGTLAAVLADRRYDAGWIDLEQWLAESRDILRLATVAGDRELTWHGGYCCVNSLTLLGQFDQALVELALLTETAAELRRPRMQWWTKSAAASLRITRGEFVVGERLAYEACAFGEGAGDADATATLLAQVYTLAWLRGLLAEVVDVIGDYAEQNPLNIIAHVAHAHALAHCGRHAEAAAALKQFTKNGFEGLPVNINWYANVALLAETAFVLEDGKIAAALLPLIAPHHKLTIDLGASSAFMGPMARYLGQILAATNQLDLAVDSLQEAVERADESGSGPWATLARNDLVTVLRQRNSTGDMNRADDVEAIALATAARLGMGDLSSRA